MRQHLHRNSGVLLLAAAAAVLGGCYTYATVDPRVQMLPRTTYLVESVNDVHPVSAVVVGDSDLQRVIYVHGAPGLASNWGAFLMHPAEGFEHVAIDRPGFGESARIGAVPSLAAQAASIEPLLEERDGRWPILVGYSLGGPIVAQLATDYPARIGGIVIVSGALDPDLEQVLFIQHFGNAPLIELLVPTPLRHANRELIQLEQELRLLKTRLHKVVCPIIIVHGTRDSLVPFENVAFMQQAFEGNEAVQIVILEGAEHFLPWSHQASLRAAINALARH